MSPGLVSIIIPCFNAARYVAAAIECSLAQTWPHCEIIVVDDGSTDDSPAIVRRFESRGVRLITQPNRGAAAARNAGLRVARGAFVQFLDADDLLAPDKIALQVAALPDAAGGIVGGPWGAFTDDPRRAVFTAQAVWRSLPAAEWLAVAFAGGGMMPPAAWLVTRATLDAAGGWNEALSLDDDGEYFCRVILRAGRVGFVSGARTYYRRHGGPRVSGSRGRRAAESSFASCTSKEQHLLAADDTPRARHALACHWSRFAWEQLTAAPDLTAAAEARWQALDSTVPAPRAGPLYNLAASLLGWRRARRLHLLSLCWRNR